MANLDEVLDGLKNSNYTKNDWLKLTDGDNKIRLISYESAVRPSHYIPSLKKYFVCVGKDNGCTFEVEAEVKKRDDDGNVVMQIDGKTPVTEKKMVHRPGIKILMWVIDRKDNKVKIAEFPTSVAKAIKELKSTVDYGFEDIPPYDITVKRIKTGAADKDVEYSVIPDRNDKELTEAEKQSINNLSNLEEMVERMKEKEMKKKENELPLEDSEETDEEEII